MTAIFGVQRRFVVFHKQFLPCSPCGDDGSRKLFSDLVVVVCQYLLILRSFFLAQVINKTISAPLSFIAGTNSRTFS